MSKIEKYEKEPAYLTWANEKQKATVMASVGDALKDVRPVLRTQSTNIYVDVDTNTHIRDGMNRSDYDFYRPGERSPRKLKELINVCDEACNNNGIVNNVINLMADFTSKGIKIIHPNKSIEKFFRGWAKKVGFRRVSERLAHYLFRHGTVLVKKQFAKLKVKDADQLTKTQANPDVSVDVEIKIVKREVPWRYTFLHPNSVDLLSEELAPFVGPEGFLYSVRIPKNVVSKVKNPKSKADRLLVSKIPDDIRKAIISGESSLPLDPDKLAVCWYKRDDWAAWARPVVAPILKDLMMLEKMKLADLAALDGAVSCIRVWKLGDLEKGIMPHPSTIRRLAEMLTNNVGGGVMDMVWGPDLHLIETSTEVHRFLGSTKYAPTLQAIYSGLGIPQTMTGSETPTGFTNNYVSLKILTERLEYGRSILREFWEKELAIVQKAMGFRLPAKVDFEDLLSDDATQQKLLLDMADRDLIDAETLQEEFGFDPDVIAIRMQRERRKRKRGAIPPKASPYHSPNKEADLEKIFASTGTFTPEEFGLELEDPKPGSIPPGERSSKWKVSPEPKGTPGEGRPQGAKDSTKRKQKQVKPRTSAAFIENLAKSEAMLNSVSKILTPVMLTACNKKTLRELTDEEAKNFESLKFHTLCQFKLEDEVTEKTVGKLLQNPLAVPSFVSSLLNQTISQHTSKNDKPLTFEVLRRYQACVFAMYRGEV